MIFLSPENTKQAKFILLTVQYFKIVILRNKISLKLCLGLKKQKLDFELIFFNNKINANP